MELGVEGLPKNIVYGATGITEITQNVRTILTTRKGTVPLDREFGITFDFLDSPMPRARALAEQEIFMQIRRYEPRVVVKKIDWLAEILEGKITPKVKLELQDGSY